MRTSGHHTAARPITHINRYVPEWRDHPDGWRSFVNTPQFPEYTSGHAVTSQAAASVLTSDLGTFPFTDRSHTARNPQLGMRSFASFQAAATQAANSRLIGGIHFPMGIDVGLTQGRRLARTVLEQVSTTA